MHKGRDLSGVCVCVHVRMSTCMFYVHQYYRAVLFIQHISLDANPMCQTQKLQTEPVSVFNAVKRVKQNKTKHKKQKIYILSMCE